MADDRDDQTEEIIESAYRITIDGERMAALLAMWDRHLDQALGETGDAPTDEVEAILAANVKRHFDAAADILEQTAVKTSTDPLAEIVDSHNLACFTVSSGGIIASANEAAQTAFQLRPGQSLNYDPFDADGERNIRAALADLRQNKLNQRHFAALAYLDDDEKPKALEIFRLDHPRLDSPVAVFRAIQPTLTPHAEEVLQQAFALTDAEAELVRALLNGETLQDFAERRDRSVQTARAQLKSILKKTASSGQVDLVRLASGLSSAPPPQTEETAPSASDIGVEWTAPLGPEDECQLPDGRVLCYATMGAEQGRPLLALHGALIGYLWPPKLREQMDRLGVSVIAPSRPGYGNSGRRKSSRNVLKDASDDFARLLDHLKIDRCPVFGHVIGSSFAMALARHHPDRVSSVICVAGYYPMTDNLIFNHMAPWQRSFLRTARYAPSLLRFMARAGRALMIKQGSESFGQGLFKTSPSDLAVLRDADNAATFRASANLSLAQGVDAFIDDSIIMTSDWTDETPDHDVPLVLLHGLEDPCVPIEAVDRFAASKPNASVVPLEGAGQLALYARPGDVEREVLRAVGLHNLDPGSSG